MSDSTDSTDSTAGSAASESAAVTSPVESEVTRSEQLAEVMFGESTIAIYGSQMQSSLDRLSDLTGMSKEERQAETREMAEFFMDARIPPNAEASRLHSLLVAHGATPPTPEQLQEWTVESRRYLRERFGDEADARVAKVKQFIAARPELGRLLTETGMGSHPAFIRALAENAHDLRITPRPRKR